MYSHRAVPALIHLHHSLVKGGAAEEARVRSQLVDLHALLKAELLPGAEVGSNNYELYHAANSFGQALPGFMFASNAWNSCV